MSKRKLILAGILGMVALLVALVAILPSSNRPEGERGRENFISDFFSLSRDRDTNSGPETPPSQTFTPTPDPEMQARLSLRKVSSVPVAGFGVFMHEQFIPVTEEDENGTVSRPMALLPSAPPTRLHPTLRYVDRISGNIYQTPAGDEIDERRITTTVVPGVREAYFTANGESVAMRLLRPNQETIATYLATLPRHTLGGDMSIGEIQGTFLPDDILSMATSPSGNIFYLMRTQSGIAGVTANSLGNGRTQIFDSPFTEWLAEWPTSNMITITTKSSAEVPGYMYSMSPATGHLTKILGGINAFTALPSKNGSLVLYNTGDLGMNVYDTTLGTSRELRIRTLPEKCVWGRNHSAIYCAVPRFADNVSYPDAWYRGEVSFSDQIWKIDLFAGTETAILDPLTVFGGEDIDAVSLALDANEDYLFFINKKDSFLWQLTLD